VLSGGERVTASAVEILDRTGAGLPTGFAVPVLETGSPGLDRDGAAKYHGHIHGKNR
jgi:hypothetical protein